MENLENLLADLQRTTASLKRANNIVSPENNDEREALQQISSNTTAVAAVGKSSAITREGSSVSTASYDYAYDDGEPIYEEQNVSSTLPRPSPPNSTSIPSHPPPISQLQYNLQTQASPEQSSYVEDDHYPATCYGASAQDYQNLVATVTKKVRRGNFSALEDLLVDWRGGEEDYDDPRTPKSIHRYDPNAPSRQSNEAGFAAVENGGYSSLNRAVNEPSTSRKETSHSSTKKILPNDECRRQGSDGMGMQLRNGNTDRQVESRLKEEDHQNLSVGAGAVGEGGRSWNAAADLDNLMEHLNQFPKSKSGSSQLGAPAASKSTSSNNNQIDTTTTGQQTTNHSQEANKSADSNDKSPTNKSSSSSSSPINGNNRRQSTIGFVVDNNQQISSINPQEPNAASSIQTTATAANRKEPNAANSTEDDSNNLDKMMSTLTSDMSRHGINTVAKGDCHTCSKPIVGQIIVALGKMWHPEHFVCAQCGEELGHRTYFERSGRPYCESDYHGLFSPRCAACSGPIKNKVMSALNQTWHPECFCCAECGREFGDGSFHEKDGRAYCRRDFFALFGPRCAACQRPIENNFITALNVQWHPECFDCQGCHRSFDNGSFFEYKGAPFCEACYHKQKGSLCFACNKPITGRCITAMGGQKYHPEHFVCSFCLRELNKGTFKEHDRKPYCHKCFEKLVA